MAVEFPGQVLAGLRACLRGEAVEKHPDFAGVHQPALTEPLNERRDGQTGLRLAVLGGHGLQLAAQFRLCAGSARRPR